MSTAHPWIDNSFSSFIPWSMIPWEGKRMQVMPAPNMKLCLPLALFPHKDTLGRCQLHKEALSPASVCFLSLGSSHHLVKCPLLPEPWSTKTKILSLAWSIFLSLSEDSLRILSKWVTTAKEGKVFHKKMKSTNTRCNKGTCAMWKSLNATFQWYLDKRAFQHQEVSCFLFAFLSTDPT